MTKPLPTIGCDPEVFLFDAAGQPVMSCGKFGGTKRKPKPIDVPKCKDAGLAILEDNVTLEFNLAPSKSIKEFENRVYYAYKHLSNNILGPMGLSPSTACEVEFPKELLESNTAAMAFGCDPDFMAFKRGEERIPPEPEQLKNVRCAGQHLHFGVDENFTKTPKWAMVQFLEALVVPWEKGPNKGHGIRKKFYGIPGLYRPKPYGFEWRSINFNWLQYLGEGMHCTFINRAYEILCGIISDDKRAREVYDFINWDQVNSLLTKSLNPAGDSNLIPMRDALKEYRQEFIDRGLEMIDESEETLVDVARVPRARNQNAFRMGAAIEAQVGDQLAENL